MKTDRCLAHVCKASWPALLVFFACLLGLATLPELKGQEQTPPPSGEPITMAPDSAAPPAENANHEEGPGASLSTQPFRELSIYIPFGKLEEVFETPGRGVFIPYEKFHELWRQARKNGAVSLPQPPPASALITKIESEMTVGPQAIGVEAAMEVEVLAKGWTTVPLRLADAVITSAELDGSRARITRAEDGSHIMHLLGAAEKTQLQKLVLKYTKAYERSPGKNVVTLQAPQAAINRWTVRIPGKGAALKLTPLVTMENTLQEGDSGNTRSPAGSDDTETGSNNPAPEETVVTAFMGAASEITFEWTPKAEGAIGLDPLLTAYTEHHAVVSEGLLRTAVNTQLNVTRAPLSSIVFTAPVNQKITAVDDANVRQWDVSEKDGMQFVTVQLFQPIERAQALNIQLEQLLGSNEKEQVDLPLVQIQGAVQQRGKVLLQAAAGLRMEVLKREGLRQLDRSELSIPPEDARQALGFEHSSVTVSLQIMVEKLAPRKESTTLIEGRLDPESSLLTVSSTVRFDIERAAVFQLELNVPLEYEIVNLVGVALPGGEAVQVESFARDAVRPERVVINLSSQAIGNVAVFASMQRKLNAVDLSKPTAKLVNAEIGLPLPSAMGSARRTGHVILWAPASIWTTIKESENLRSVSPQEVYSTIPSPRGAVDYPGYESVFAAAFSEGAPKLIVDFERRKPYITARQRLTAHVESAAVQYRALFDVDIRYSGVDSLRIDVPTSISDRLRSVTVGIRDAVMSPQPADVEKDYTAWRFTSDGEMLGSRRLELVWEQPLLNLAIEKPVRIRIPRLIPQGVDRAEGQIVLSRAEGIDLAPEGEPAGLRPIDPQQDILGDPAPDAARAFEFTSPWTLDIRAVRFEPQGVKGANLDRGLVRMVRTRGGAVSVQSLYRLQSSLQRLKVSLPSGAQFDSQPLFINGKPVVLEKGSGDAYSVPLLGLSPDEQVLIELRYSLPPEAPLQPPLFADDAAQQRTYIAFYLPSNLTLVGHGGDWSEEYAWSRENFVAKAVPRRALQDLLPWVAEGTAAGFSGIKEFATDGDVYLFSTIKPAPKQQLSLTSTPSWFFHLMSCGAIAGIGLFAIRFPLLRKLQLLALITFGAACLGVFWPTLANQLVNAGAFAAAAFVVFLWLIAALAPVAENWMQMKAKAAEVARESEEAKSAQQPVFLPEKLQKPFVPPDKPDPPADAASAGGDHNG